MEHQPLDDAHEHELRAKETNEQLGDDNDIEADLTHKAYARSAEKKRKDKAPTPTARKPRGIALPSYISPPDLASKLNCTLREVTVFSWFVSRFRLLCVYAHKILCTRFLSLGLSVCYLHHRRLRS